VGCPTRFAVNDELMGASTGVPACRRFARMLAKDTSVVTGVVGIRGRTRGIGGAGAGGAGGGALGWDKSRLGEFLRAENGSPNFKGEKN